jgi:hypothetical protein
MSALEGARELAAPKDSGVDAAATPIVLVADNRSLRRYIRDGALPGVVGPRSVNSVHSASGLVLTAAPHMTTYVEVYLLARARCLVYTDSGFSYTALWIGNHTCRMYGKDALAKVPGKMQAALDQQAREEREAEEAARRAAAAAAGAAAAQRQQPQDVTLPQQQKQQQQQQLDPALQASLKQAQQDDTQAQLDNLDMKPVHLPPRMPRHGQIHGQRQHPPEWQAQYSGELQALQDQLEKEDRRFDYASGRRRELIGAGRAARVPDAADDAGRRQGPAAAEAELLQQWRGALQTWWAQAQERRRRSGA